MHTSSTTNTVHRRNKQCTLKYSYLLSNSLTVLHHKLFALRSLCICRIILVPSHIHLSPLPPSHADVSANMQSYIFHNRFFEAPKSHSPCCLHKCNCFTVQSLNKILLCKQSSIGQLISYVSNRLQEQCFPNKC